MQTNFSILNVISSAGWKSNLLTAYNSSLKSLYEVFPNPPPLLRSQIPNIVLDQEDSEEESESDDSVTELTRKPSTPNPKIQQFLSLIQVPMLN